jgi:hypothetical protein
MDICWNKLKMHGPINVKSHNNTSKWQIEFNSAFKGLIYMGPCIVIIFKYRSPNKMHMLQSLFYLTIALHVSGIIITDLQEHKTTVTTASANRYTVIDRVKLLLLHSTKVNVLFSNSVSLFCRHCCTERNCTSECSTY